MQTIELKPTLAYGKEIRRFKIAINTACPLRCEYCFIDKDSGEVVSWENVQGALEMLLASPGQVKKLLIYGGEPFLRFDLVEKIALYARAEAVKAGKDLDLSLCTSGVAVKREQLEFLRDQRFFLSVSMDGDAETHNERRKFLGGKGTWDKIAPNLPLIFEVMGKRPVMAIQCVHPTNVEKMLSNFQTLSGLGFENIEIEVIHGFEWKVKNQLFQPQMKKVFDWILSESRQGRPKFMVCSLVPLMLGEGILREDMCPFHSSMECYPDGKFSFYPFAFVDWEGRKRCGVGDASSGVLERYQGCRFDKDSDLCKNCTQDYYRNPTVNEGNDCYLWRTQMARRFMFDVMQRSKTEPWLRAYVQEALIRCRIS